MICSRHLKLHEEGPEADLSNAGTVLGSPVSELFQAMDKAELSRIPWI